MNMKNNLPALISCPRLRMTSGATYSKLYLNINYFHRLSFENSSNTKFELNYK